MILNAISVANYFVELANSKNVDLKQFGLMKRVYITHGFSLALLDRSILDSRFDVVEAWKNGPVIPSVYHSFKYNRNNPIREKSIILDYTGNEVKIKTPKLEDEEIILISNMVWKKYAGMGDEEIIEMLHRPGTPWALCYERERNNPIPDLYTKIFYRKVVDKALANEKRLLTD
jgi:uncharacterized phage-associated protein